MQRPTDFDMSGLISESDTELPELELGSETSSGDECRSWTQPLAPVSSTSVLQHPIWSHDHVREVVDAYCDATTRRNLMIVLLWCHHDDELLTPLGAALAELALE